MGTSQSSKEAPLRNTETAIEAIQRGYQPVPLISGGKKPKLTGWPKLRWENTPEGIEKARAQFDTWADEGMGGIGVLLGKPSGDLIDIDLDHPITARLRHHFLPPTPARSGRASRPSTHYWYQAMPGTLQESRTFKLPPGSDGVSEMIVEYRSTLGQTAIPGNVHPTGELYTWENKPWGGKNGPAVVDGRMLLVQVATLGLCSLLALNWPGQGARHEAYLALAGGLLRVGDGVHPYWERNINIVIGAVADATRDGDGASTRIAETVDTTLKRLRQGKPASGWGKLAEILGDDVVKQVRVILAEIESAAGLPSRVSGDLSIEKLAVATEHPRKEGPVTAQERDERYRSDEHDLAGVTPQNDEELASEERVGTWGAQDNESHITRQVERIEPTVLERSDGQALMYPGRLNMLYGPSEAAKSWIAMYTCIQLMRRGERVVYIDLEDEPINTFERMQALGATDDELRNLFRYVQPDEPIAPMQRTKWGEVRATELGKLNERLFNDLLEDHDPALIVVDGMTVLYSLHGLDNNDSVQTEIITGWLRRLTRNNRSTVIIIDHTGKNPQRGSLPIGSQHKVAMVGGTLLQTYPVRQPMRGAVGEIELLVLKDKPGYVRGASEKSGNRAQLAARVFMDSTVADRTVMTLEAPAERSTGPVQQVDLRGDRIAERMLKIQEEDNLILTGFEHQIGKELSMTELMLAVFQVQSVDELDQAQQKLVRRVVLRLIDQGRVIKQGKTKGATYSLAVDVED